MNRTDLQRLSSVRIREARLLLPAGEYSGAYYLAGYAVECALKACVARQTQQFDFPDRQFVIDSWVHDLQKLVKAARLDEVLRSEIKQDGALKERWNVVIAWSESSRYSILGQRAAVALVEAVDDPEGGILQWITRFW